MQTKTNPGFDMQSESKLSRISDWLQEQVWFQELKGKWEELDSKKRNYIFYGVTGGLALVAIIFIITVVTGVYSKKTDIAKKAELLEMLQNASQEIQKLRSFGGFSAQPDGQKINWESHFSATAETAGIPQSSITTSKPKQGAKGTITEESLYDVQVKHVNIKQIIRYALKLESGRHPIKLRNLSIETDGAEGYMDAKLAISAFTINE